MNKNKDKINEKNFFKTFLEKIEKTIKNIQEEIKKNHK